MLLPSAVPWISEDRLLCSVQSIKVVAMRSEKPNVFHPVSQTSFPNVAFGTVLMPLGRTRLIDDGPLSSFQRRSSSASSFHALSSPGDRWCDALGFVPNFK